MAIYPANMRRSKSATKMYDQFRIIAKTLRACQATIEANQRELTQLQEEAQKLRIELYKLEPDDEVSIYKNTYSDNYGAFRFVNTGYDVIIEPTKVEAL